LHACAIPNIAFLAPDRLSRGDGFPQFSVLIGLIFKKREKGVLEYKASLITA
jgi:hypothetical protein